MTFGSPIKDGKLLEILKKGDLQGFAIGDSVVLVATPNPAE